LEATSKRYWDGKSEYRQKLYDILNSWQLQAGAAGQIEAAFEKGFAEWRSGSLGNQPHWAWSYEPGVDGVGSVQLDGGTVWPLSTPEEYESNKRHVSDLWSTVKTWQSTQDYALLKPRIDALQAKIASARAALQLANFDGTGPCGNC
jgi:hypothetical protein